MDSLFDRLASSGNPEILALGDAASGLAAWIAIDRPELGPAFGGIRRRSYADEGAGLADALRLARAMTEKCALLELPAGGAKGVILADRLRDPERGYREIARAVERLGGRFYTGPDVGTGPTELGWMAAETRFVTPPDDEGPGEIGAATAIGVEHAIGAALVHLDGDERWDERTIVVQGLGGVGGRLARTLAERGARVHATDTDAGRLDRAAREGDLVPLKPGDEYATRCDVFAPCAVGGILGPERAQDLPARLVCGSANNVLASDDVAELLRRRGVLLVPDPVASAGGLLLGATFHLEGRRPTADEIGRRIASLTRSVLERARTDGSTTSRALRRAVDERVAQRLEMSS